ncbi:MAG: hypothetical protein FWF30_00080 [Coriobacteriia bacterium]|nr:hypothetical protein [Coriobacteriia bacterium]
MFGNKRPHLLDERGQMAVEMAVLMPVLIVVALILFNCLNYLAASARFDRLVEQAVRTQAASPASGSYGMASRADSCEQLLRGAFSDYPDVQVKVEAEAVAWGGGSSEDAGGGLAFSLLPKQEAYTCRLTYTPWPFQKAVFGLKLFQVEHTRRLVIDPYRPGVLW